MCCEQYAVQCEDVCNVRVCVQCEDVCNVRVCVQCEGVCCGQQKRKVMHRCVSEYNEAVFPDEWCKDIRKPNTVLNCSTSDCARWSVGEWSECLCGGQGFRNRSVTCVRGVTRVDRDVCEECSNPISEVQVCTGSPCGEYPPTCAL